MPTVEALSVQDTDLRVISGCTVGEGDPSLYAQGFTYDPNTDIIYHTAFGTSIMVHTSSLRILFLATNGCMTPVRLWRLAMKKGLSQPYEQHGLDGIDYGEVQRYMHNFPSVIPGMSPDEVEALEELDNVELVEQALIHQGKYWVWMSPDG